MRFLIVALILLAICVWAEAHKYVCNYRNKLSHHKDTCNIKCKNAFFHKCMESCKAVKAQEDEAKPIYSDADYEILKHYGHGGIDHAQEDWLFPFGPRRHSNAQDQIYYRPIGRYHAQDQFGVYHHNRYAQDQFHHLRFAQDGQDAQDERYNHFRHHYHSNAQDAEFFRHSLAYGFRRAQEERKIGCRKYCSAKAAKRVCHKL